MNAMPLLVITGATGFVGRAIVRQACADGCRVRALVREPRAAQWLAEQFGAELFAGNVLDPATLVDAFTGAAAVIHLVGVIREHGAQTFDRVHRQATGNVVAAAQTAGVARLIHMSALGTRPGARSRYHQTKWAAEEIVRQSGLAWTIFRPSLIYGTGDQSLSLLAKLVKFAPVIPVLGNGQSKVQPVSVATVARCFVAAFNHAGAVRQTYDLCGPVAFTWDELYDKLLTTQGRHKLKWHVPLPVARVVAALAEWLLPVPPFTRDQLLMLQEDNTGDPGPAARDFNLSAQLAGNQRNEVSDFDAFLLHGVAVAKRDGIK